MAGTWSLTLYHSKDSCMSHKVKAFANVKISKKEGLPRRQKDSQVSNGRFPFTMSCSIAVKTIQVNYDIVDQLASSVIAHL